MWYPTLRFLILQHGFYESVCNQPKTSTGDGDPFTEEKKCVKHCQSPPYSKYSRVAAISLMPRPINYWISNSFLPTSKSSLWSGWSLRFFPELWKILTQSFIYWLVASSLPVYFRPVRSNVRWLSPQHLTCIRLDANRRAFWLVAERQMRWPAGKHTLNTLSNTAKYYFHHFSCGTTSALLVLHGQC